MDPTLDRSSPKPVSPSKMAHALSTFMNEAGCVDPWRFLFPHNKEFSFFSHVHQSYSRIDYFFIDKTLLPFVKKSEYSAIVESDHAPVLLDLGFPLNQAQRPSWRLDLTLLADENFYKRISTAIVNFLLANKSDSISPSILWETLKVVIRGEIISYTAACNKARKLKQEQLIDSMLDLDHRHSTSPSPELYKERLALQMQYNLISTQETEQHLLRS